MFARGIRVWFWTRKRNFFSLLLRDCPSGPPSHLSSEYFRLFPSSCSHLHLVPGLISTESNLLPLMFSWCDAKWSTGLRLYRYSVVFKSNCTVLGSLEPRQWCTWPSAYNLLRMLIDTELLQLIVWLTLHLNWWHLHTPSKPISHPIITVSTRLPPGKNIISCYMKY